MNEILVLVDEAESYPTDGAAQVDFIKTIGSDKNIRFHKDTFPFRLLLPLPRRCEDLLLLAVTIYSVDKRQSRGTPKDVYGDRWQRKFKIVLPVWDLDFWNSENNKSELINILEFLSGDRYEFIFIPRTQTGPIQELLKFDDEKQPPTNSDLIILFSGGIDSLGATIEALQQGRRPTLVSHRPSSIINKRQTNLVGLIKEKFCLSILPHLSIWANRTGGERAKENTQRTRSFLFTCFGAVAAKMLNVDEIRLCDNGVVSFNLPQSAQSIGTYMTRSTHPQYLSKMQTLLKNVLDIDSLKLENTLLFKTKKEMMQLIADSGHPELIQEATSCTHTEGQTKHQPHCGTCSQCVDRRFASLAAGYEDYDLKERYARDIFTDELINGDERTYSENYVRFADKLKKAINADHFVKEYGEIIDCIPEEGDAVSFVSQSFDMFQRHQNDVHLVLKEQIETNSENLRDGMLPENCLIKMVINNKIKTDPRKDYAEKLGDLIRKGLPPAFQTVKARDEKHVQDVGEAVLITAEETLTREGPQLPFAGVTTKPDFSDITNPGNPLFVEFKYLKARKRLNAVITEMTSRVIIYRDQGAWVLFVVYDPSRTIVNDDDFSRKFEKHEGIVVRISR